MFTFALTIGLRNGWLTDAEYVTAARNGWLALGNNTNGSGAFDRVCPGTDKAPDGNLAAQQAFSGRPTRCSAPIVPASAERVVATSPL